MTVYRSVSVCLCVAICVGVFVFKDSIARVVAEALPQQQSFTELYFVEPAHLPKTVAPGEVAEFTYAVTNQTQTSQRYHVVTLVETPNSTLVVQDIYVRVPAGKRVTRQVGFAVPAERLPATVLVTLPSQNQSVHFDVQKGDS